MNMGDYFEVKSSTWGQKNGGAYRIRTDDNHTASVYAFELKDNNQKTYIIPII